MDDSTVEDPQLTDHLDVVVSLLALTMLAAAYEIVPASVTPLIVDGAGVDAAAVSGLVSAMFGVAVLASIPAGGLIDRIGTRRAIAGAAVLFVIAGVGSWQFAVVGSFEGLVAMRLLAGVGFVVVWNAGVGVFGQFDDPATATSLFTASGPVGFALGHVTGPLVAEFAGWPAVFLVYPLLALVPAAYVVATGGVRSLGNVDAEITRFREYGRLLRNRTVVLLCVLGFASYSLYLFINSWMPSYLNEVMGVSIVGSGALVALFPLMGAVSRISGGLVTDRLLGGRRRPVIVVSFVVAVPLLVASVATTNVAVLTLTLVILGFFVQLSLGLFYAYVPDVLPDRFATAGVALLTSVSLGGAFSAPLVAGFLIDRSGAYVTAFGYAVVLAVAGSVLALFLADG